MAPQSRGHKDKAARSFKVVKNSKRTQTTKHYRFQSFSDRITKLNIDPVRRTDARSADFESRDATSSHFRNALEDWRDKNLTDHFSNFLRDVEPLSESLPQLLHHADRVASLLFQYIESGTSLSLEPLLDLLAQFAHDLGARFESYFESSLRALAHVARTSEDIETIERCLNSLVWLFKYLSRLLVPDLRPTYDLLAPLLGREKQKPFIARFTAEALSFLLRKAAAKYERDSAPLRTFVQHVLKDVGRDCENELYQRAIMTLFVEGVKGVQNGLHSAGLPILQELLTSMFDPPQDGAPSTVQHDVVRGVVTALIHHCTAQTFAPALGKILEFVEQHTSNSDHLRNGVSLLYLVSTVRKGTRVTSWSTLFEPLEQILDAACTLPDTTLDIWTQRQLLVTTAAMFHLSPLHDARRYHRLITAISESGNMAKHFAFFCDTFASLDPDRFKEIALPILRRCTAARSDVSLVVLYPRLLALGIISEQGTARFDIGSAWERTISQDFSHFSESLGRHELGDELLYKCNAELQLPLGASAALQLASVFDKHSVDKAGPSNLSRQLLWGPVFKSLAGAAATPAERLALFHRARAHAHDFTGLVPFWQGIEIVLSSLASAAVPADTGPGTEGTEQLIPSVEVMLSLPSHELRFVGLRILQHLYTVTGKNIPSALDTALAIEQSSFDAQSARSVSMHIRRLAAGYGDILSDPWLCRAMPAYLLGLLHVHLSTVHTDVAEAIKIICQHNAAHDVVMDLAVRWLIGSDDDYDELSLGSHDDGDNSAVEKRFYTDFECSNVANVDHLAEKSWERMSNVPDRLRRSFDRTHRHVPLVNRRCREQILKILNAIPQVAERRSRLLVPLFLEWATNIDTLAEESDGSNATIADSSKQRWNRKDQKAMVTVFASMDNPRVLHRSEAVHEALLGLLANGDTDLQKPALKALMAWRSPVLERYKEDLFNLLDDDRFRDTLARIQIVGDDIEDPAIRNEDREALMPVLLRILYGRAIAKDGANARGGGLEARKKAIFTAVKRLGDYELQQFVAHSLGPLRGVKPLTDDDVLSTRKRQGLLNTVKTMILVLRQDAEPLVGQLADASLYCLFHSYAAMEHEIAETESSTDSLLKDVRQLSLQCLTLLCESFPDHDWHIYVQPLYDQVISPRLAKLPIESAHSISGLMRLFASWAKSPQTAPFLFADRDLVVTQLAACLQVHSAKDEVKTFIIGSILGPLLRFSPQEIVIADGIRRHGHMLLTGVEHVLRGSPSKELLDLSVGFITQIGPLIPVEKCAGLIEVSLFLLQQPSGRVTPKVKNGILKALQILFDNLGARGNDAADQEKPLRQIGHAFEKTFTTEKSTDSSSTRAHALAEETFTTISSLFAFFEDRESRTVLCEVFDAVTKPSKALSQVAEVCTALNAFDDSRLDEPAWDVRGDAWAKAASFRPDYKLAQLTPMVWIALFYIRDQEDSLRSNAVTFLKRFIDCIKEADGDEHVKLLAFADLSLLQAVQRGMRKDSEAMRMAYLEVLAYALRELPGWTAINDMRNLLVGSDEEEASFFNNILHIQQHRRLRALRRLAKEASSGMLDSGNIARILLPLLDHLALDSKQPSEEDDAKSTSDGNLAFESTVTIGALAQWLEWPQYRALLRRYGGYVSERPEQEKAAMRLLSTLVNALSQADTEKKQAGESVADKDYSRLAKTMPQPEKLAEELSRQILPQLTQYLRNKDEATVSRRAPVAVTVVKLLRLLPEVDFATKLPPVLMDLAHVLRSKADEARNLTRRTFADVAIIVGPAYFGFILRELRRALQRGYQLHVLSFTLHSILVKVATVFNPGDLDNCVDEMAAIVMDDIFGVTGQEKDAEEYISKMKEVKSSKSYDSMELVASLTTLQHLADLVRPVQLLLREKLDDRSVRKVEELLRRIRRGLVRNEAVAQQGILVFCHEIWAETYRNAESSSSGTRVDYKTKRYLINMKSAHKSANRGLTSIHTGRVVCFAVDLMRDIIPKNEELQKPSKLAGFMDMIGDAVVSGTEEVRISVFRLIASLLRVVKAPFPRLDKDAAVYAREAMRVVRDAHSTKTEAAQAALRMISEVLQKRHDTVIREGDTAFLLKALRSDLDEPERQAPAFAFLRAVIARRIVVPEAYELIDDVARIMVTNHTKESRKLARDTYFAFMMDYPQAKGRLDKQVAYLVKNLSYQHLEGRQSVMEVLHLMLTKVGNDLVGDIQDLVFLPLVMSMINDDEEKCRTFAGILLKDLFTRADTARAKGWLKLMQGWVNQSENVALRQAGFQCWQLYLEAVPDSADKTNGFVSAVEGALGDNGNGPDTTTHDLVYFALKALKAWAQLSKVSAFSAHLTHLWAAIREAQFYPSAWVRLVASQLVGAYLGHFAKHAPDLGSLPLVNSHGLKLGQDELSQITRAGLIALQITDVHTELVDQAVHNLSFVLRCLAANGMQLGHAGRNAPTVDGHTMIDADGSADEWDGVSDSDGSGRDEIRAEGQSAFDHVMVQLNAVMRREISVSGNKAGVALYPKTATMKLLAAMVSSNTLPLAHLSTLAPVLLRTLNGLTDPNMTQATSANAEYNSAQTALIESARELMGKLQDTLGNERYLAALMTVKKEARERREDRRRKRKLDAVNEPERMDALKRKKRDAAKARKKVKSQEMRGRRRGW